jgi:hypothetical protein
MPYKNPESEFIAMQLAEEQRKRYEEEMKNNTDEENEDEIIDDEEDYNLKKIIESTLREGYDPNKFEFKKLVLINFTSREKFERILFDNEHGKCEEWKKWMAKIKKILPFAQKEINQKEKKLNFYIKDAEKLIKERQQMGLDDGVDNK